MENIVRTPEDILTVRGWYSVVDPDDEDTLLIKNDDAKLITKIHVSSVGIAITWGQTTVAMATLEQAFSWLVTQEAMEDQEP